MKVHGITGDVKKALLQIWIQEDRDGQKVLWHEDLKNRNVVAYPLTRVIYGAGSSPYNLRATMHKHVSRYKDSNPGTAKALLEDTYVDDIQYGGESAEELMKFKEEAIAIMKEGGFTMHKWHSSIASLESTAAEDQVKDSSGGTKRQALSHEKGINSVTKILGIQWDKERDLLHISFEQCITADHHVTKRKIFGVINSIYNLLSLVSSVMVTAKILFNEVCIKKLTWSEAVPVDILRSWNAWIKGLKGCTTVSLPRSITSCGKGKVSLRGFAAASKSAVCATLYAVATYLDGSTKQNLLAAKSRIASRDLSIPRLGTVEAHMLAKLKKYVKTLVSLMDIEVDMRSDSMTAL